MLISTKFGGGIMCDLFNNFKDGNLNMVHSKLSIPPILLNFFTKHKDTVY